MDPKNDAPAQDTTDESTMDEFDTVFDSLFDKESGTNDEEDGAGQADAGAAGAAADDDQSGESAGGEDGAAQPAAAGGDTRAADDSGLPAATDNAADGGAAQPANQQVDWEARFRELESRIQAQPAAQPAAQPSAAAEAPAETPVYTPEEQAELAQLQQDWPDAHRLFSLLARQLQIDTLKYAFSEVDKVVSPLQQTVGTYAADDHLAAIYEAHEDYDQVYQPVMEWIAQQPSFLKSAYENVVKQGTAADVNTMIARFKQETQWKSPASAPPAQAVATTPATPAGARPAELSDAAKQAAKAMGAVGTKRGNTASGAVDPNDFDGAWAEAVSSR